MTGEFEMGSYGKANKYQSNGKYKEAATEYAAIAFEGLLDKNFELDERSLVALGIMLEAISCDIQADNRGRAIHLQAITEQLYQEMKQRRIMEADSEERCIKGLIEEWIGDSRLMIGSEQVIGQYEKAKEQYEGLDFGVRMGWGMEREFDHAQWAYESFIGHHGYELPEDIVSQYKFIDRVEFKIQVAEELLSQHTANESS